MSTAPPGRRGRAQWLAPAAKLFGVALVFAAFAFLGSHGAAWPAASALAPAAASVGDAGARAEPSANASSGAAPIAADTQAAADAGSGTGDARPDAPPTGAITGDGRVVLNLATEPDLRRLPGIGASRAHAILALRARLGHFRRVEDLLRVKGIGRRSLARLRPLLVVDAP